MYKKIRIGLIYMYKITKILNENRWLCEVRIQDGTERWSENDRQKAICSIISSARVLNNDYISEEQIVMVDQQPVLPRQITKEEEKLLQDIKSGNKVVLDFDDYRLKYNITRKECEMLQNIREGLV